MQHFSSVHREIGSNEVVGLPEVPANATSLATSSTTPTGSRKRKSTLPERIPSLDDAHLSQSAAGDEQQQRLTESKRPHLMQPVLSNFSKPILLPFGVPFGVLGVISNNCNFGCQTETALDLSLKTNKRQSTDPASKPSQPPKSPTTPELKQQQQQQQQQHRQNFSNIQNDHLLRWFIEHRDRPYPGAEDTKLLSMATGLTYSQVKKWFANKRMRSKGPASQQSAGATTDQTIPVTNGNECTSQASSLA